MMMPHPTIQRDYAAARRARSASEHRAPTMTGVPATTRQVSPTALRVQIGHLLIGIGSRLSGERVERVRPSAPQRAA